MQRDAPYLDVNKHNEAHSYYNVPPEASDDEDVNRKILKGTKINS